MTVIVDANYVPLLCRGERSKTKGYRSLSLYVADRFYGTRDGSDNVVDDKRDNE